MTRDDQGAASAAPDIEVIVVDEAPLHFREFVEQYLAEQEGDE